MTYHQALHEWQLQEAKNKLSKVINLAMNDGPQIITLRGERAAVVLSMEEYISLTRTNNKLSTFFKQSPLAGSNIDLTRDDDIGRDIDL